MLSNTVHTDATTEELPVQNTHGKTSYLAWIVMTECIAIILCSTLMLLTAPSSPVVTAEWLNVSFPQLNWIANATAIFDVISSCTTFWINDKYGIKNSIILAAIITTIGCWIRWIAVLVPVDHRYTVFIIGQTFGSIGNPFVVNVVTKLVATWFAPQHRTIATSILTLHIGGALAPLVFPVIAKSAEDVPKMLIVTACICTICSVPAFFLPKKPRTAPSATAETSRVASWEGVKLISRNTTFWWIVVVSSVQFGMILAFATVMLEVIIPHGYSEQQAGLCEAFLVISGFFGGGIAGYWLGKSGQYVTMVKVFTLCSVLSCALLAINIIPNAFPTVLTSCMVYGFFGFGLFPLYFELASEGT
ncbi:unnamed protein product [Mucor hiemalis]